MANSNPLVEKIEKILLPLYGEFVTRSSIKVNCERIQTSPDGLAQSQLPEFLEKLEVTLLLFKDKADVKGIMGKLRKLPLLPEEEKVERLIQKAPKEVIDDIIKAATVQLEKKIGELEEAKRGLEDKVKERTRELRDSYEKLKVTQAQLIQSAKMAAVGQLGAGVAHELNNPLGGILGYAQFILHKFRRPDFGIDDFKNCQRYLEFIERESIRTKSIVASLLKFSRRPVSLKKEPLDMKKTMEETFSIIGHQLKLRDIRLTTDFSPDLAWVRGNANQLQQIFVNLILNAQQAMTDGGQLKIRAENIMDKETQRPEKIRMEFTDTGYGIPKENLDKIFEPFFSTRGKEKGVGLGLSVAYQIIKDHEGTIEVASEVGKGTTFTITLPVAEK